MRMHITLFAVLLTVAAGCRSVRPEAGLPLSAFDGPTPKITANDRGFWFLIDDDSTEFTPFVEVKSGEAREVFYAVARGDRTVRLLPVSRFAYPMLNSARDGTVQVRWLGSPDQAGEDFGEPVGWASGKASSTVKWAGTPPADGTPVALLAGEAPADLKLGKWLLGTATLRGGRLTNVVKSPDAEGPFAVVPDGRADAGTYRVRTSNANIEDVPGASIRATNVAVPSGTPTRYSWRPAALRSEGDLYIGRHNGGAVAMASNPVMVQGLALAVTDEPLGVAPKGATHLVRAFQAVANERYLAASFWFARAQPDVAGNYYAGALRALELIAAAGYVDWMRQAVLVNAEGLDADAGLYLARGHYVAGDFSRSDDFATRAIDRFAAWARPGSNIGGGRARMLKAQIAARQGEFKTAYQHAKAAAEMFDEVDDAMRAADAELHASLYALNGANARAAVKNAALARSRFFHGNSPYWSGFAEIALSDVYRRFGETGEAEKMARFAAMRFEEMNDDVARNRARIAEGRVAGERSPSQGKNELEIAFDRARTSGDLTGLLDAAASLVVIGAAESETTATYGRVILGGLDRTDDPFVRERASQAIALLCSRGLPGAVEKATDATEVDIARARAACNVADQRETSDTMVSALVAQGYAALSAGKLDEAGSLADRARRSVNDDLRMNAPTQAAEAIFLSAVIERSASAVDAEKTALEGVRLLGESLDSTRLAPTYAELADRMVARGQIWLASELFRAAMAAAGDQAQNELRRELVMRRLTVLHAAGQMEEARQAALAAEPILGGAGASSAPLLARLWTYQADILARLDRDADADLAEDKAAAQLEEVDGPTRLEITLLATRLAIDRNDLTAAQGKLRRATALEKGLETGLASAEQRSLLQAQIATLHAALAERSADATAASKHYQDAVAKLSSLASTPDVLRARIRALGGAAETATSDAVVTDAVRQLEASRDAATKRAPDLVPAATETLAKVEILAGRPSRALELVEQARLSGAAPAPSALDALCLEARAAALSGRKDTAENLRRCAETSAAQRKVDATLIAAFADPDMSDRQRQRTARQLDASYGADLPARELQRLKLVTEIVVGTEKANESEEGRLQKSLQRAIDQNKPGRVVDAATDLVDYLTRTGQASKATQVVDENSKWFYEADPESAGRLVRLQTQARVASLDPIATFSFAARALSEIPDASPEDEARLTLAAATNDVLLGMWQQARSRTREAMNRAREARDRRLQRRIRAFAERFSIPLSE